MMKPLTPLGISDFKKLREGGHYFVDKSLFIKELIIGPQAILFARPRRFGKTLNMSMVRYFFDCTAGDNSLLFKGLDITNDEGAMARQGKHPVIFLSFKDVKNLTWVDMLDKMTQLLRAELSRCAYLLDKEGVDAIDREAFLQIVAGKASLPTLSNSLNLLSKLLAKHHGANTVILIDEYDSPIHIAWLHGFYNEAIPFFRDLLSGALKDNVHLEKGVLTGILRVAKESIFSGLNNFGISTVTSFDLFQNKFGFTTQEVQKMLADHGMNGSEWQEIEAWYDGYRFGSEVIFNPWSILNYVENPANGTQPYWVNTSDNAILKRLFFRGASNISAHLDSLLRGETVSVALGDHVSFQDLDEDENVVWTLLLHAGYLKQQNMRQVHIRRFYDLAIPNKEVLFVYHDIIGKWLKSDLRATTHDQMLEHLTRGELLPFEKYLRPFVEQVFSYFDVPAGMAENFYHAFLLGLFAKLEPWYTILSNRESGYGRFDICLIPRETGKKGVIIEIKAPDPDRGETLETAIQAAEDQIMKKKYHTHLNAHGVHEIFQVALAVQQKSFLAKEITP